MTSSSGSVMHDNPSLRNGIRHQLNLLLAPPFMPTLLLLLVVLLKQFLFKLLVLLYLIFCGDMVSIGLTVRHHDLILSTV